MSDEEDGSIDIPTPEEREEMSASEKREVAARLEADARGGVNEMFDGEAREMMHVALDQAEALGRAQVMHAEGEVGEEVVERAKERLHAAIEEVADADE